MNLDPKVSWWLNFLLFALQSAAGLAWSQYLDPKTAALLFMGLGYVSSLLAFAVHGSVPGIASQVSNVGKAIIVFAVLLLSLVLLGGPARAADIATKAPANPFASLATGYPYQTQGVYFGVYTEGGGGSVQGTAVGVNSNSLVTNEVGVGGTVGYAWGVPGKNVFVAAEAMFGWTNFNGSAPGFSLSGPVNFEQRFKVGTPLSSFLSLLPNLGLPSAPPFPNLPNGQTVSNQQVYLMAGMKEKDNSLAFGLPQFRQWTISPTLGIGTLGQLPNGVAIDAWVETVFPDKSICAGPFACARTGQEVLAGLAFYY